MTIRSLRRLFQLCWGFAFTCCTFSSFAQLGTTGGEWQNYAGDAGSTKYSPLDQITARNVDQLQIAWRWSSPDAAISEERGLRTGQFKPTPIMIGGVLYVSTALSQVAAIDAGTGNLIWVHDPKSYERPRPANSGFQHRGVAYWTDGDDERIVIATFVFPAWIPSAVENTIVISGP